MANRSIIAAAAVAAAIAGSTAVAQQGPGAPPLVGIIGADQFPGSNVSILPMIAPDFLPTTCEPHPVLINAGNIGVFNDSTVEWTFDVRYGGVAQRATLAAGEIRTFNVVADQTVDILANGLGADATGLAAGRLYRLHVSDNQWAMSGF